MGREQAAAAALVVDRLDHRPGDGEAVIGRGAAADLVEDDEAARRRLGEDRRGLDHLDHEGRAAAREIVRCADAAEQAVDEAELRALGGHEAAGLGEHRDQRVLAQEGRFAAHVRAGDQPQPRRFGQAADRWRRSARRPARSAASTTGWRPPSTSKQAASSNVGRRPAALGRALGQRRGDVEPGERVGGRGDRLGRAQRRLDQLLEMRRFGGERVRAGLADPRSPARADRAR